MIESSRYRRVYLVRHPLVHIDSKGICYGDSDVPLEEGWDSTLESLVNTLCRLPIRDRPLQIWHSDLARCSEPALWLSEKMGAETRSDRRLRERFFGTWQSVAWSKIPLLEVERAHDMLELPSTFRPGGGETTDEVSQRAMCWLNDAVAFPGNESTTIVAIAHSGSITALCGSLLALPPLQWTPYYLKPSQHLVIHLNVEDRSAIVALPTAEQ